MALFPLVLLIVILHGLAGNSHVPTPVYPFSEHYTFTNVTMFPVHLSAVYTGVTLTKYNVRTVTNTDFYPVYSNVLVTVTESPQEVYVTKIKNIFETRYLPENRFVTHNVDITQTEIDRIIETEFITTTETLTAVHSKTITDYALVYLTTFTNVTVFVSETASSTVLVPEAYISTFIKTVTLHGSATLLRNYYSPEYHTVTCTDTKLYQITQTCLQQ